MKVKFLLSVLLLVAFSIPGMCQDGSEVILNYHSDITVDKDSTILVTETIKVRVTGDKIKHGIYREFPIDCDNQYANEHGVYFYVIDVWRDGQVESYHTDCRMNKVFLYVGSRDALIQPGVYTYVIKYETDQQLRFSKDRDVLCWNVTGDGWEFPIEKASATVTFPSDISTNSLNLKAFTRNMGSQKFLTKLDGSGRPYFETTSKLSAKDGFIIVVSRPNGAVNEPVPEARIALSFGNGKGRPYGLIVFVSVLIYYLIIWRTVGKDPAKGTIIPFYTPPNDLSPAAVRYIRRVGYDKKTFAAAIINMAAKRFVKIEENNGIYTVTKDQADESVLSVDEKALAAALLGTDKSITLTRQLSQKLSFADAALKGALSKAYGSYFSKNSWYLVPGFLLSIASLEHDAILAGIEPNAVFGFGIWLVGWTAGMLFFLSVIIRSWKIASYGTVTPNQARFQTIFILPFLACEIGTLWGLATFGSPLLVVLFLSTITINCIFYSLLKSPTIAGRKLIDQIDGFRMYLSVAEGDALNTMNPPAKTPELFEKYRPYALALDVEQAWSDKFSEVLTEEMMSGRSGNPSQYSGSGN